MNASTPYIQVAERERTTLHVLQSQFASVGARDKVGATRGDLRECECVRTVNHWHHQSVVNRHGNANMVTNKGKVSLSDTLPFV